MRGISLTIAVAVFGSVSADSNVSGQVGKPADLCSSCEDAVNQLVSKGIKEGCQAACEAIPGVSSLCPLICGSIPSLCGKGVVDCGQKVCSAISVCASNPWEYEVIWNFSKPTYSPALHGDTITLTSTDVSPDVPAGKVQMCIKCTAGTWWKAITMFQGTNYLKEVAHTQDHQGETNCGLVEADELSNHYFTLSKAETLGVHVNVYHITNAGDMKAGGSYLWTWSKDSTSASSVVV